MAYPSSAQDILGKKSEIESMKSVTQIYERIEGVDLSENTGIGVELSNDMDLASSRGLGRSGKTSITKDTIRFYGPRGDRFFDNFAV